MPSTATGFPSLLAACFFVCFFCWLLVGWTTFQTADCCLGLEWKEGGVQEVHQRTYLGLAGHVKIFESKLRHIFGPSDKSLWLDLDNDECAILSMDGFR